MNKAMYIGASLTSIKPSDYPKYLKWDFGRFYTGDTLIFASNENQYFTFGLRIKSIK